MPAVVVVEKTPGLEVQKPCLVRASNLFLFSKPPIKLLMRKLIALVSLLLSASAAMAQTDKAPAVTKLPGEEKLSVRERAERDFLMPVRRKKIAEAPKVTVSNADLESTAAPELDATAHYTEATEAHPEEVASPAHETAPRSRAARHAAWLAARRAHLHEARAEERAAEARAERRAEARRAAHHTSKASKSRRSKKAAHTSKATHRTTKSSAHHSTKKAATHKTKKVVTKKSARHAAAKKVKTKTKRAAKHKRRR